MSQFTETFVLRLQFTVLVLTNFAQGIEYLENGVPKLSGGDIDVQTCVDNFDIHKDNIIRTQDSRAMGAKYLSEIELDTRLECLRLCCETEHCDVFVYEDKGPGSCYLFECGPPKDFKCKFTHHVNYTSGILGINRHSNSDLEVEIRHEKDLNKLRNAANIPQLPTKESNSSLSNNVPTMMKPTSGTLSIYDKEKPVDKNTSKCSRNQFECRTSKDCIAIYNACDGVPQCPDGSDEAKELGCPDTSIGTTGAPLLVPQQNEPPRMNIVLGSPSLGRLNSHTNAVPKQHVVDRVQDDYSNTGQRQEQKQSSRGREGVVQQQDNQQNRDEQQQQLLQFPSASAYQQQQQQQKQQQQLLYSQQQQQLPLSVGMQQSNWFPRPNNGPPLINPLSEITTSQIFNHKGNGLQLSETDADSTSIRYSDLNVVNNNKWEWEQQSRQCSRTERKNNTTWTVQTEYRIWNVQRQYNVNDMNQREYQQHTLNNAYYSDIYNNKPQLQENALYNNQQNTDPYIQNRLPYTQEDMANNNWQANEQPVNLKHEQDQMAHELKHSKEHFDVTSDAGQVAVKTTNQVMQPHEHDHTKYAVVVDELAETIENIEDGVAQTPGGAVLSLILGLLITCMLAILIGCRLRVVRRRIRRGGGKSYAHDADYLVNGMYL